MKRKRKKPDTFLETYRRLRKLWGFAPVSRIVDKDKKKKGRARIKREFKKELDNQ